MNFKLSNLLAKNGINGFGRFDNNDLNSVSLCVNEDGSVSLLVVLKNGTDITVSTNGSAEISEWDLESNTITEHTVTKKLVDQLAGAVTV